MRDCLGQQRRKRITFRGELVLVIEAHTHSKVSRAFTASGAVTAVSIRTIQQRRYVNRATVASDRRGRWFVHKNTFRRRDLASDMNNMKKHSLRAWDPICPGERLASYPIACPSYQPHEHKAYQLIHHSRKTCGEIVKVAHEFKKQATKGDYSNGALL